MPPICCPHQNVIKMVMLTTYRRLWILPIVQFLGAVLGWRLCRRNVKCGSIMLKKFISLLQMLIRMGYKSERETIMWSWFCLLMLRSKSKRLRKYANYHCKRLLILKFWLRKKRKLTLRIMFRWLKVEKCKRKTINNTFQNLLKVTLNRNRKDLKKHQFPFKVLRRFKTQLKRWTNSWAHLSKKCNKNGQ